MKKTLMMFILSLVLMVVVCQNMAATTFAGRDDKDTTYYICRDNKEVAELLCMNADEFDLSVYKMVAKKAVSRKEDDGVGLYVVMLNTDKTFVVCYRTEEYDIFFYNEKRE